MTQTGPRCSREAFSFQSFLVAQPHSWDHVDAIPGYLEWKVSIGQRERSRNKNSAQNSSRVNKRELLVSTVWHRAVNRDSHCLPDGMWADSKHVGIQTWPLSALSAFHSASRPSNVVKRDDQIKTTAPTKGWWGVGWGGLHCCVCGDLHSADPELALITATHLSPVSKNSPRVVGPWLLLIIHFISSRSHLWSKRERSRRRAEFSSALRLCPG